MHMVYSDTMKKKLFTKHKDFKGKVALEELRRAHVVIALLSMALAFLMIIISIYPIQFDMMLSSVAAALLIIVTAVSLSIAFAIKIK
jgi:ABC-type protease/lipase transport system fused ATPase/permease subunit